MILLEALLRRSLRKEALSKLLGEVLAGFVVAGTDVVVVDDTAQILAYDEDRLSVWCHVQNHPGDFPQLISVYGRTRRDFTELELIKKVAIAGKIDCLMLNRPDEPWLMTLVRANGDHLAVEIHEGDAVDDEEPELRLVNPSLLDD